MAKRSPLAEKLEQTRERIAAAAGRAGRQASQVTLVAVTKNAAPEQIREIIQLGVTDLAESRVPILTQRAAQMNEFFHRQHVQTPAAGPARLRWHLVGHLQRNKVKPALSVVDLVHSVDSLRLAEEIDTKAERFGRKIPVLLQVNAGEEQTKFGVAVGAAIHLAEQMDTMPNIQLMGLMAMAPLTDNTDAARRVFARTRELFEEIKWQKIGGNFFRHLSMGMSNDFEAAVEEGATLVRIGSLLFGGPAGEQEEQA